MWELEYSQEVKFYFLDKYPYTFDLLVKIEELKHLTDEIPPEGFKQEEPNLYVWEVLRHLVYCRIRGQRITIAAVKPIE